MSDMLMKRHGDLLLIRIGEMPRNLKKTDSKILAVGEVSGHKHQLTGQATVWENAGKRTLGNLIPSLIDDGPLHNAIPRKFFYAHTKQELVHEEHKPIMIEEGVYAVVIEREYDPFVLAMLEHVRMREEEARKRAEREVYD